MIVSLGPTDGYVLVAPDQIDGLNFIESIGEFCFGLY